MMLYSVAIHQDNGAFLAVVPDLPNVEVGGDNMAQVIGDVRLAIIDHLQNLVSNNQPIPAGQDIGVHLGNQKYLGHTWAIITLDSLRLSQHLVPIELALPKSLLLSIYHELEYEANNDEIPNELLSTFIIDTIKERLTHKKR